MNTPLKPFSIFKSQSSTWNSMTMRSRDWEQDYRLKTKTKTKTLAKWTRVHSSSRP